LESLGCKKAWEAATELGRLLVNLSSLSGASGGVFASLWGRLNCPEAGKVALT